MPRSSILTHADSKAAKGHRRSVLFIVNPFSGVGQKRTFHQTVKRQLNAALFQYDICYTEAPGHARQLAAQGVKDGYDIIVPVGGDGSVNEVAGALIDTDTILGVVPAGSGNGFAMHLGFGRNISRAIAYLNTAQVRTIDSCLLNDRPFVNVAGTGFDAWVAYKTRHSRFRGLMGYMRMAMQETIAYQAKSYTIVLDGKTLKRDCLTVEVANARMFGYNMQIAPLADLDDGLLDVVIIKKVPKWRYFPSMWRFPAGSVHKSRLVEYYRAKKVEIFTEGKYPVHIDGEGFMTQHKLNFTIKPLSLKVLIPQKNILQHGKKEP